MDERMRAALEYAINKDTARPLPPGTTFQGCLKEYLRFMYLLQVSNSQDVD
jgi:hypothetical protein